MIKKLYLQILVAASLMAALLMIPASVNAEDVSTHEAKSGIFMKPSSGLDIKPDNEREKTPILSSTVFPLSDTMDIGLLFGKPRNQDIPDKKHPLDKRAFLDIIFHF